MAKMIEKIVNIETGIEEIIERDLTEQEIAERNEAIAKAQSLADAQAKVSATKAALLEKLGISEDEAKLLLS